MRSRRRMTAFKDIMFVVSDSALKIRRLDGPRRSRSRARLHFSCSLHTSDCDRPDMRCDGTSSGLSAKIVASGTEWLDGPRSAYRVVPSSYPLRHPWMAVVPVLCIPICSTHSKIHPSFDSLTSQCTGLRELFLRNST